MDIVVDSCVMRLYDAPGDPNYKIFFAWLHGKGTLCISHPMLNEYNRHGNQLIPALLNYLTTQNRLTRIPNKTLNAFSADKNYAYLCNALDIPHARLTFVSKRKKLVSFDEKLRKSVSKFKKVDGIKPSATALPDAAFFN